MNNLLTVSSPLFCSKVKELEEELHVVTNNLRSLEISEEKVSATNNAEQSLFGTGKFI